MSAGPGTQSTPRRYRPRNFGVTPFLAFKASREGSRSPPISCISSVQAAAPNRRWVRDTTELRIGSGELYLAAILLYSRFIVGWAVSAVNGRHLALRAIGAPIGDEL